MKNVMKSMKIQSVIGTIAFALVPPQALAQHTRPMQVQSAPRPIQSTPAPVHSASAPAPAPTHTAPTPAPVHTAPTPAPAQTVSTPAHTTPAHTTPMQATPTQTTPAAAHNNPISTPTAVNHTQSLAPQAAVNRPTSSERFNASTMVRPASSLRPAQAAPRIETRRPDGARVVVVGSSHGFVERPIAARPGFYARTYVVGGRSYARVYREAAFHGFVYHAYVPRLYFGPAFYGWAYDPWVAPVYFSWGWNTAPWYGYYGVYFRPAPVYTTPAVWLTDFLIAENLKLAYENQQAAQSSTSTNTAQQATMTPEVRALIAEEVRRQIEFERRQATSGDNQTPVTFLNDAPPALDPNSRVVVVSMDLNVPMEGGSCRLTPGDILYRASDAVGDDGQIGVVVLSSKAGSCAVNSATSVDLGTLQDMHNDFRQQIGSGLAVLAQNQGKGGLPTGPSASPRLVPEGDANVDTDAASALRAQEQIANLNKRP